MKIKIDYVPRSETLTYTGNKLFTEEQMAEIARA